MRAHSRPSAAVAPRAPSRSTTHLARPVGQRRSQDSPAPAGNRRRRRRAPTSCWGRSLAGPGAAPSPAAAAGPGRDGANPGPRRRAGPHGSPVPPRPHCVPGCIASHGSRCPPRAGTNSPIQGTRKGFPLGYFPAQHGLGLFRKQLATSTLLAEISFKVFNPCEGKVNIKTQTTQL